MTFLFARVQSARAQPNSITVASKIDTEGALLGNMVASVLRAQGMDVRTRLQLGPTRIVRQALLAGAIDLYPEYTGNGAGFFRRQGDPAWHDAARAYELVKSLDTAANHLVWLQPAPADNGWGIAMPAAIARARGLSTLGDLAGFASTGGLKLAASVEFVESADALPAFERAYGFRLRQEQILMLAGGDTAATIRAASEGVSGVNAAMAYGTDGALDALGMVLLADPRHAQIVFQPAPVIRQAVLDAHPQIAQWLAAVFASLTLPVLRHLNGRIAAEGADPAVVARDHLASLGMRG